MLHVGRTQLGFGDDVKRILRWKPCEGRCSRLQSSPRLIWSHPTPPGSQDVRFDALGSTPFEGTCCVISISTLLCPPVGTTRFPRFKNWSLNFLSSSVHMKGIQGQ